MELQETIPHQWNKPIVVPIAKVNQSQTGSASEDDKENDGESFKVTFGNRASLVSQKCPLMSTTQQLTKLTQGTKEP
jgi:hypothetical protein